jgi:hypothetical protein
LYKAVSLSGAFHGRSDDLLKVALLKSQVCQNGVDVVDTVVMLKGEECFHCNQAWNFQTLGITTISKTIKNAILSLKDTQHNDTDAIILSVATVAIILTVLTPIHQGASVPDGHLF